MFEKFKVSKDVYEELQEEVINAVTNYNYERYYLSMFLESITYKINRVLGYKY